MSNIIICGEGVVLGFETQFGIGQDSGGMVIVGVLQTEGRNLGELLDNEELGIANLNSSVTVAPQGTHGFEVKFMHSANTSILAIDSDGIALSIVAKEEMRQLFFALNTDALMRGNKFERFVADISSWLGIQTLILALQNRGSFDTSLISKLSPSFANISIPQSQRNHQMLAYSTFDLSTNEFGRSINKLTSLSTLNFAAGASLSDGDFGVSLLGERVETKKMIYENFGIELRRTDDDISCRVGGTFILKLDRNMEFTLAGIFSTKSVLFTAYSSDNCSIEISSRVALSSLAISIGVGVDGATFAMTGAVMVNNLYIFAGIAVTSSPPYFSLISAAITSIDGRVSLMNLVEEIAGISTSAVKCLDVVAVCDFEMNEVMVTETIKDMPSEDDANYPAKKESVSSQIKERFNDSADSSLRIEGDVQLTHIGDDNSNQYIMTDKAKMRHYRIDQSGKISLSCQLYICNSPMKIGNDDINVGIFMCGEIEIFGTKTKLLFLIDKGKSLVAFVQLPYINIFGVIKISNSAKELGVDDSISNNPINNTFIGELSGVNSNKKDGATLYLNIQQDKGDVTFYVSASINVLNIFIYDTLILIKDRKVYINIEQSAWGFTTIFSVESDLSGFGSACFVARVSFNTDGFSKALRQAQASLQSAAQKIKAGIDDANRKASDAKRKISSLNGQIDKCNNRIKSYNSSLHSCKWYQIGRKISLAAQIACQEVAKGGIYAAIAVANGVLSVANDAIALSGKIAATTFQSISYLLGAVTQIFWIKSFELGIEISKEKSAISSCLSLTVFGKDVNISEQIDITAMINGLESLIKAVESKVEKSLNEKSDALIKDIESGKVSRSYVDNSIIEAEYQLIKDKHTDIGESLANYKKLTALRDVVEDFYVDISDLHFDTYNEEDLDSSTIATTLTEMRWTEEQNSLHSRGVIDNNFISSLRDVVTNIDAADGVSDSTQPSTRLSMVASIKEMVAIQQTNQKKATQRKSLLSRVSHNNEIKRAKRGSRVDNSELSAEQANNNYINGIHSLLESHFGDATKEQLHDDATSEFTKSVAIAIQQFKNNNNTTFRKK